MLEQDDPLGSTPCFIESQEVKEEPNHPTARFSTTPGDPLALKLDRISKKPKDEPDDSTINSDLSSAADFQSDWEASEEEPLADASNSTAPLALKRLNQEELLPVVRRCDQVAVSASKRRRGVDRVDVQTSRPASHRRTDTNIAAPAEIDNDFIKREVKHELEDDSVENAPTWMTPTRMTSKSRGSSSTAASDYSRPYKTTSRDRRSRDGGSARGTVVASPSRGRGRVASRGRGRTARRGRGRIASRGRGHSAVFASLGGRPALTPSRGRGRGRGRGGRASPPQTSDHSSGGEVVPDTSPSRSGRGSGGRDSASATPSETSDPSSGDEVTPDTRPSRRGRGRGRRRGRGRGRGRAIQVPRQPRAGVAYLRAGGTPSRSDVVEVESDGPTPERIGEDDPGDDVPSLRPTRRAFTSEAETRLRADAQEDSVAKSHGKSGCDALPGGPTPTSGQCHGVSPSLLQPAPVMAMEESRTYYARLLKEGSPHVTLQDHKMYTPTGGQRKLTSTWSEFQEVCVDGKVKPFVACKRCLGVYSFNAFNGTSSLTRHLMLHKREDERTAAKDSDEQNASTAVWMSRRRRKIPDEELPEVQASLASAASKCCYLDIQPYHSIQGDGFKQLAQTLINLGATHGGIRAEDVLPSESTVAQYAENAAEELRTKLKSQLKEVRTTIGVATDLWEMEETGAYYATVTAQYVDDSFTLQSVVLATKLFAERHTGVNIMTFTADVLESFGIDVSKCKLTTDSASNDDSASCSMGFISDAALNINLVLSHTFDEVTRDSVCEGIDETLQSCAELVTFMKRSGLNAELTRKLIQQEDTRWISKLTMLKAVAEAFPKLVKEFTDNEEIRDRLLKVDLDFLNELVRILDPFREAAEILQAEKVPTLHLVVKCANKLRRGLKEGSSDTLNDAQRAYVQLVKMRLAENIHRLRIEPLHLAAHALQPGWRLKSYGDWADVQEGHRFLLARATEDAASLASEEQAQKSRPERVVRVRTNTFLDSDSSDEEPAVDIATLAARARQELDAYLLAPGGQGQDILSYWRRKESELPLLAKVAKSVLAIPASTTSLERSGSTAGRVIGELRTQLSPNSADALLLLNSHVNRELQTRSEEIDDATQDCR